MFRLKRLVRIIAFDLGKRIFEAELSDGKRKRSEDAKAKDVADTGQIGVLIYTYRTGVGRSFPFLEIVGELLQKKVAVLNGHDPCMIAWKPRAETVHARRDITFA